MEIKIMAFREVYKLFVDAWELYRKYSARRLDDGTVIENVHIYVNHKASVGDSGLNSAEVYKIRIPTDVENADQYLPPEEYAKLEDPEEHWTIQTDDQIVLGEYNQEIEKPADLKDVRLRHCKVLSWSDNRFGGLPHWKIEGE